MDKTVEVVAAAAVSVLDCSLTLFGLSSLNLTKA